MTDPLTILGLERGDLLAAAGCLHRYRQPHLVALVARLSEAEHRGTLARNHAPDATETGPGATNSHDWHSDPTQPTNGPQNAGMEQER